MFRSIKEDVQSVFAKDPAARHWIEVVLCYPGLHALWIHHGTHFLYKHKQYILARIIAHVARHCTGIEIHPGATIGRRVFIDHGMGVVIGETAEVGDDCIIYKGVVLGGTSRERTKRHPTLMPNVVVGTNACVLGAITIGEGARIGAGSVVVRDVPSGTTVVGIPGRIVDEHRTPIMDLEHGNLPDPVAEAVTCMLKECEEMTERIAKLEKDMGVLSFYDEELEKLKKRVKEEFE